MTWLDSMGTTLGGIGLLPVVTIERAEDTVPLARALRAGGIGCAEITLRTPASTEAIRRIAVEEPALLLGAGTVLTVGQAETALAAGARFLVAPGLDLDVVMWCAEREASLIPGVITPTEVMRALVLGLKLLKFFPAEEAGGAPMLRALHGPLPEARFIPTGGVSAANLTSYLRLPNVVACGGSWVAPSALIAAGAWDEIARRAAEASALAAAARQDGGNQ